MLSRPNTINNKKDQMEPRVLISILNWNQYHYTLKCIQSLSTLDYKNYEILVIDNHSENDSVEQIGEKYPQIKIIALESNLGFAHGHSKGADYAAQNGFDLIWLLNPDLFVHPNALNALVDAYSKYPKAIYGSVTVNNFKDLIVDFGGGHEMTNEKESSIYNFYENKKVSEIKNTIREISSVEGSSMMIPLKVIKEVGFMDIRFFMYGEETDYCYHIRKSGIKSLMVANSFVVHEGATTFSLSGNLEYIRQYYRTRNFLLFSMRYKNLTKIQMINKKGGPLAFIKFYLKWLVFSRDKKKQHYGNYVENLAIVHAILGIMGKTLSPENFIHD